MTYYYLCGKDHYVHAHRGEDLKLGSLCPAKDCASRLRPAPEGKGERCPSCTRGLLLLADIDGIEVHLCSFCGRSRIVADATA